MTSCGKLWKVVEENISCGRLWKEFDIRYDAIIQKLGIMINEMDIE
jgi:hypothetical protein